VKLNTSKGKSCYLATVRFNLHNHSSSKIRFNTEKIFLWQPPVATSCGNLIAVM